MRSTCILSFTRKEWHDVAAQRRARFRGRTRSSHPRPPWSGRTRSTPRPCPRNTHAHLGRAHFFRPPRRGPRGNAEDLWAPHRPPRRHPLVSLFFRHQAHRQRTRCKATPLESYRVALESTTPTHVVSAITKLTRRAQSSYRLDAVGIAVGGVVNAHGTVESAPFLKWHNVPLATLVTDSSHLPTFVANDLSAYTQIQHWFGAGTGHANFAVITVGVGVGYGCVANGARLENEDSGIGLIGHWPLDPLGPICSQGHRGCAEAMLTTPAICRDASAAVGRPLGWHDVITLATDKHPAVTTILAASGRALGRLVGMVASLTAPEVVIIGGEGVALASLSGNSLSAGIAEVRDPRASAIRITLSNGSNEAWCRGAAAIALQGYIATGSTR